MKTFSERRHELHHGPSLGDARESDWYQFLLDIDDLIASGRVKRWTEARAFLERVQETVQATGRVTLAQRRAYENIRAGRTNVDDWLAS